MRIYDVYTDPKLRRGYKKLLLAQGMTIVAADKIYDRIGIYISRIKGVNYDRLLHGAATEVEFRSALDYIFKDRWRNHIGYTEIPDHFYSYIDYIHMLVALSKVDTVDGIEIDFTADRADSPGRYENPYIGSDGRLRLIAIPALLRRLANGRADGLDNSSLTDVCRKFYPFLSDTMTDSDWSELITAVFERKGRRKDTSSVRNIAITLPDGSRQVMESTETFYHAVAMIGAERLLTSTISHLRHRVVVRSVPPKYKLFFKQIGDGIFLNLLGTPLDKFKTLRVLDSFYGLGMSPELCNVAAERNRNPGRILEQTPAPEKAPDEASGRKAEENEVRPTPEAESAPESVPDYSRADNYEVEDHDRNQGYSFGNLFSGFE